MHACRKGTIIENTGSVIILEALDPDGDTLTYLLYYSPDNGVSWIPVEQDIAGTNVEWNTAGLTPGDQYKLRLVATDGFRTADVVSDAFSVEASSVTVYLPVLIR